MRKPNLTIPQKVLPKQVWIHLLSFLDAKSLRETLLLNKEWNKLGNDERLEKISNRYIVPIMKKVNAMNPFELTRWFLSEREESREFVRLKKVEGLKYVINKYLVVSSFLSLFLGLLLALTLGIQTKIPLMLSVSRMFMVYLNSTDSCPSFVKK